jgi:hypothetical protein
MKKESDEWETPQALFDSLDKVYHFSIDVCSSKFNENDKVPLYRTCLAVNDYLKDELWYCDPSLARPRQLNKLDLINLINFMNPPYSNIKPFIQQALNDRDRFGWTTICLLPVDPSTKWWALFWDYEKSRPINNVSVKFLPKRLKFERNGVPSKHCYNRPCGIVKIMRNVDGI